MFGLDFRSPQRLATSSGSVSLNSPLVPSHVIQAALAESLNSSSRNCHSWIWPEPESKQNKKKRNMNEESVQPYGFSDGTSGWQTINLSAQQAAKLAVLRHGQPLLEAKINSDSNGTTIHKGLIIITSSIITPPLYGCRDDCVWMYASWFFHALPSHPLWCIFWDNLEAISFFQGEHDVRGTGSTESGLWFIINVQLCGTCVIKGMTKNCSLVVSCTEK